MQEAIKLVDTVARWAGYGVLTLIALALVGMILEAQISFDAGLLATGVSLPFVVFAAELSILQVPTWLPSAALVAWFVWFIYWAVSGGVPPRFG